MDNTVRMVSPKQAPALSGLAAGRAFLESLRDPLGTAAALKEQYGDFVALRAGPLKAVLLGHPRYVDEVLNERSSSFKKDKRYRSTPRLLGEGLLTTDGERWRVQRRVAQPAFHHERLGRYALAMTECTDRILSTWTVGETRDVHRDIMATALAIVGKTLFNVDITESSTEMARAFMVLLEHWNDRATSLVPIPEWAPTPHNVKFSRALRHLEKLLAKLIELRRARPADENDDLLSMLLAAHEGGVAGMTEALIRDEFVTMVLAGYETSANSIAWTLHLLAQRPDVEANLVEELRALGEPSEWRHERLVPSRWLDGVISESLRLYPPVWGFGREAIETTEIGGHRVEAGTQVFICPYLNHRDARFFTEPERFLPERWFSDGAKRLPAGAYLPFGRGSRMCIGRSFAILEASVLLSRILLRFRLRPPANLKLVARSGITLRPEGGLPQIIAARE
jgi:cytochrome P450